MKHQDAWGCCCAPPGCDDPALLCTVVPDIDAGALPGFMTLMSTFCKQQPVLQQVGYQTSPTCPFICTNSLRGTTDAAYTLHVCS